MLSSLGMVCALHHFTREAKGLKGSRFTSQFFLISKRVNFSGLHSALEWARHHSDMFYEDL